MRETPSYIKTNRMRGLPDGCFCDTDDEYYEYDEYDKYDDHTEDHCSIY